jgi:hypothetical protein
MTLMTSLSIMFILVTLAVRTKPTISYAPAYVAIRKREQITGNSSYNNMETP